MIFATFLLEYLLFFFSVEGSIYQENFLTAGVFGLPYTNKHQKFFWVSYHIDGGFGGARCYNHRDITFNCTNLVPILFNCFFLLPETTSESPPETPLSLPKLIETGLNSRMCTFW